MTDSSPGIQRKRSGKGFVYADTNGKTIRDPDVLRRIRSLVIPPAWRDVWICPLANGHLQATGRDARNRKQYRYHARWKEVRDSTKFERMVAFGHALSNIRDHVEHDLTLPGLPRDKVLATVVRLLELTLIRVGNEEYAKANGSYGLTTLRDRHVDIYGSTIRFRFLGKSKKKHEVGIRDQRLARILKKCQEIPGYELFQYINESGEAAPIDSSDVNEYLRQIAGEDFTAKDFRTWTATVLAAMACQRLTEEKPTKKQLVQAVELVANLLGNTPSVCRKCYIHPAILDGYLEGKLTKIMSGKNGHKNPSLQGLAPEEVSVLHYLKSVSS